MAVSPQSLKDLTKTIRNVGSALAPRRTGNLRNALRQYNTPDRMVKYDKNGDATIIFFVAPPNAKYGKYWNDPDVSYTVRKQRTGNKASINYGKKAYKSSEVKAATKKYVKETGKQIVKDLRQTIKKELGSR
jgi:hypothetical protein